MKFTEVLSQLNIPYKTEGHHHCRPGWVQIDCPWCGRDTQKWHLGYSLDGHFLNCWRCGPHRPIETLMEITGLPFYQCKKLLSGIEPTETKKEKPKGKLIIPKGVGKLGRPHLHYICKRGFVPSEIEELWKIKGIGIAAKLAWRIFIPIIYHGETVSWTTRSISDNPKVTRYISAPLKEESIPHKSLLYGEDYAQQTIIVTEGPFDVWRIGPGAVATLGVGYSHAQMLRMSHYPVRVICFDREKTAQIRAKKLCNNLSVFPGETYNIQLSSKDAAGATAKEIKKIRGFL